MSDFFKHWYLWCIVIMILGAILFFLIPVIQENYVGGILAFVGILATFIVIGNYAQVQEIKRDVDNRLKVLEMIIPSMQEFANVWSEFANENKNKTSSKKNGRKTKDSGTELEDKSE